MVKQTIFRTRSFMGDIAFRADQFLHFNSPRIGRGNFGISGFADSVTFPLGNEIVVHYDKEITAYQLN